VLDWKLILLCVGRIDLLDKYLGQKANYLLSTQNSKSITFSSEGSVPPFFYVLLFTIRLLGVKATGDDKKQTKVSKLAKQEVLMVNIGSTSTGGKVLNVKAVLHTPTDYIADKQDLAKIALTQPACTEIGEKIALSRRIDKHWRLIGWGKITRAA